MKIVVKSGKTKPKALGLVRDVVLLGADRACDLVLDDPDVAPFHALIHRTDGATYTCFDLGSSTGTYVGPDRVWTCPLSGGTILRLGTTDLVLEEEDVKAASERAESLGADADSGPRLVVVGDPETDRASFDYSQMDPEAAASVQYDRLRLQGLLQAAGTLSNITSDEDVFAAALDSILILHGWDFAAVVLCDPDRNAPRVCAFRTRAGEDVSEWPISRTILERATRHRQSVRITSTSLDTELKRAGSVRRHSIKSAMCGILGVRGEQDTVLYIVNRSRARAFADDDLAYLTAVCEMSGDALARLRARERVMERNRQLSRERRCPQGDDLGLIHHCRAMRGLMETVEKVAATDSCVLLLGDSGTGKELVAREIHRLSSRRDEPFQPVCLASISPTVIQSELFGHTKGAFTGAEARRVGLVRAAEGGTLFLDEIADLPLDAQASLLRLIREKEVRPVGQDGYDQVDVRILAATNKDLQGAVRRGKFRDDLYHRVNVVQLHIPPLRDRKEDIPLLAVLILHGIKSRWQRELPQGISEDAMRCLTHYSWPGNVGELSNVLERAVILGRGPLVEPHDLPREVQQGVEPGLVPIRPLREVEKDHIAQTLVRMGGRRGKAAEALGISRRTLYAKIKLYRLDRFAEGDSGNAGQN